MSGVMAGCRCVSIIIITVSHVTSGPVMELPVFANNLRSSGSWQDVLDQAHELWQQARSAADYREQLEPRLRLLQLLHTLPRTGHFLSEREAALLALQAPDVLNQSEAGCFLHAARYVSTLASAGETPLTRDALESIYNRLAATNTQTALRTTETLALNPAHTPTPALLVPRMLDNALDWFTTAGFNEMHAAEKAVLVYLRMLDLQPFPARHELLALLTASYFTECAGLPPLILFSDEQNAARFPAILESGFRMLTQPLVEFFAENLTRTIQTALTV